MADPPTLPNSSFPAPLKAPAVEIVDPSSPSPPLSPLLGEESKRVTGASKSPSNNDGVFADDDDDGCDKEDEDEDGDGDVNENEDANEWEDIKGDDDDDMESLYGELLDAISDTDDDVDSSNNNTTTTTVFTPSESHLLRSRLRLLGPTRFFHETVVAGGIPARKLCTAFGVRCPPFFLRGEGVPDEAFHALLGVCMARELRKRVKLGEWNTVEDAVKLLQRAGRVVVLTGAGISTSLGIPDFRSKDTGLYARLEHLGLSDPQEVFDLHVFREDPSIFYSVAKDILPSSKKYTPTHAFIRLLQDKGKLLTNFTQNIDNLEEFAGIEKERLVQCHGSFATATCIECKHQVECKAIYNDLRAGNVARCESCLERIRLAAKPGFKRKRSSNDSDLKPKKTKKRKKQDYEDSTDDDDDNNNNEDDNHPLAGVMKPDITFFGEDLPPRFHDRLVNHDRDLVDLVIVIGTSLKVAPVSEVVGVIPPHVPQIYISREACNHVEFDIDLLGDCDTVVTELCRRLGWGLEHEMVREGKIDVQAVEGSQSRFLIKPREEDIDASSGFASMEGHSAAAAVETRIRKAPEEKGEGEGMLEETNTELAPSVEPLPPPPPTNGLDKKVEDRIHNLLENGKTKYSEEFTDV